MPDKDVVIKAIEACMDQFHPAYCNECYLDGFRSEITCREKLMRDAVALLREQETEIIRCKGCKHYDHDTQSCNNGLDGIFLPDWFCADGERR